MLNERAEEALAVVVSEDCGTDRGWLIRCASTEANWAEERDNVLQYIDDGFRGEGCDLGIANGVNLPESMIPGSRLDYVGQMGAVDREQFLRVVKREHARWCYQGHATPDDAHREFPDNFEGLSEEDGFWAWKHRHTGMSDAKRETLERYWREIHPTRGGGGDGRAKR